MTDRRRGADRVLLGLTLGLSVPSVAAVVADASASGWLAFAPGPAASTVLLSRATLLAVAACMIGTALAWAAVAWRCRGTAPRGLALGAAAAYSAVTLVDTGLGPIAPWPRDVTVREWVRAGRTVAGLAGWVPAFALLAFGRQWGDRPGSGPPADPAGEHEGES